MSEKENTKTNTDTKKANQKNLVVENGKLVLKEPKLVRKFELAIYDQDEDAYGNMTWKRVVYEKPVIVTASSEKELNEALEKYKMCGQQVKILREIDPPTKADRIKFKKELKKYLAEKDKQKQQDKNDQQENIEEHNSDVDETESEDIVEDEEVFKEDFEEDEETTVVKKNSKSNIKPVLQKQPPKYFKLGDIEVKEDNGVMYQKQFIRLSDLEASNIRVIDNKTNRVVNLNGKHIEMKKWILVETTTLNGEETLEENLK